MSKQPFIIRCRAVILKEAKFLAVKHFPEATYYALPGGHMELGEDPLVCIKREVKEELGVEIANPILKYIYSWDGNDGVPNTEFVFVINAGPEFDNLDISNATHAFEVVEMHWVGSEGLDHVVYPKILLEDLKENKFQFEGVKFVRE